LDPKKVHVLCNTMSNYTEDLSQLNECKDEWNIYLNVALELEPNQFECTDFNVTSFWIMHKTRLPKLYSIASWALNILSNSCSVERSISKYNYLLQPNRLSTDDKNIKMFNFLYFNTVLLDQFDLIDEEQDVEIINEQQQQE